MIRPLAAALVFVAAATAARAGPPSVPFGQLGDAVQERLDVLTDPQGRAEKRERKALLKAQDLLEREVVNLADEVKLARKLEARITGRVPPETGLEPVLNAVADELRIAAESDLSCARLALGSGPAKTARERVDRFVDRASAALTAATAAPTRKKGLAQIARVLKHLRSAERLFAKKDVVSVFTALGTPAATIVDERIEEGSGIVWLDGAFWTHGDGGTGARLYRSAHADFRAAQQIEIPGAENVDWEDIAVLDGDLLVCDVGDNLRLRDEVVLYRIRPSQAGADLVATYAGRYPDGAHDAEAAAVVDGRVHVFTKGDPGATRTSVYRFDALAEDATNVPTRVGGLDLPPGTLITAADVHPGSGRLTLLAYGAVLVFPPGIVTGTPEHLRQAFALQSEALCFRGDTLVFTNEQRSLYLAPRFLERL